MAEERIAIHEDPALTEWKIKKVNSNMKKFQRKVDGKRGPLHVKMLEATYPVSDMAILPQYLMKMSISTDDPDDRISRHNPERIILSRSIDRESKKYGATSLSQ